MVEESVEEVLVEGLAQRLAASEGLCDDRETGYHICDLERLNVRNQELEYVSRKMRTKLGLTDRVWCRYETRLFWASCASALPS